MYDIYTVSSTHILLFLAKRGDDGVVGNRRHLQLCLGISTNTNTGQEKDRQANMGAVI